MQWVFGSVALAIVAILVWRWIIRNKPYRRPWRVQFAYWFTPYAWLRWVGLILLSASLLIAIGVLLLGVWAFANQSSFVSNMLPATFLAIPIGQDTAANVGAALVGAVLGAVIAGVVSVSLQTQEFSSGSILKKKAEIYEPLYNELLSLREQLGDKYPGGYGTTPGMPRGSRTTYYTLWTEIKGESRYLHVPIWIKTSLDNHLQEISAYRTIKEQARQRAYQKVHHVLTQEFERPYETGDGKILDEMLEDIVKVNPQNANNYFRRPNLPDLPSEQYRYMFLRASEESLKVPEVQKLKAHHEGILDHTEWLIKELKILILYINRRYEAQGDLF